MFFCKHKFGGIKDGYQFCAKCNKAVPVDPLRCQHKWDVLSEFTTTSVFNLNICDHVYMMKCSNCGALKKFSLRDS